MLRTTLACLLLTCWLPAQASRMSAPLDFGRDVRPILSNTCFTCHGPDANKRKANLRLDIADGDLQTKSKKRAIVPGDAAASELLRRVHGEGKKMPPSSSGKVLSQDQIGILEHWIAEGAVRTPHWAFVPPRSEPPPPSRWPTANAIDAFVHATLDEHGLVPAPLADRATLLRRVTLDLTGLPPAPDRLEAFLRDESQDAFAREVDRLLATSQHAEHMARFWLDAARYGDTHGLHLDNVRTMWPYRDWVVSAFQRNLPFDRFTEEQLAGDLLPNPTREQRIASGFNRCNPTTAEGGLIDAEYLAVYAKDRVATTSTVWLGLTMGCATCHDHKFDPITQKDFYRLYAFFNSLAEEASDRNANSAPPELAVPTPSQAADLASLDAEIASTTARVSAPDPELDAAQAAWETATREHLVGQWRVLHPTSALSRGGATLTVQQDGTVVASGVNPPRDEYEVVVATQGENLRALRIEALVDPKTNGVGRGNPPNIVLTTASAEISSVADPLVARTLVLSSAATDLEQRDFPARGVLDADPKTGWALEGGREPHELVLASSEPFCFAGGTLIRIRLRFESIFANHQLARFRIAVSSEEGVLPSKLGPWSASAPIAASSFREAHEKEPRAEELTWKEHPEWKDGVVLELPAQDNSATWLRRTITCTSARPMTLAFGSDDGIRVYLDKAKVFDKLVARPVAPDQDRVVVMLHPGDNELRLAISNVGGGHAFYFRVIGEETSGVPAAIAEALQDPAKTGAERVRTYYRATFSPRVRAWQQELATLREKREKVDKMIVRTMVSEERKEPRPAHLLVRGLYDHPGELVQRGVPAIFAQLSAKEPTRRDLARWLVAPENPLTARVFVNRLWAQLFGTGIVKTVEDFGYQGEWPSHKELLDWLACEFVRSGWDVAHMLRLMVGSKTYCQESRGDAASWQRDPENRLLARGPRVRLDAETIRDQALFVSGLLVEKLGGPGVRPYQPGDLWKEVGYVGSNTMNFVQDHGEALWRRSIYTFLKRTAPPASMQIFDAPSREACQVRRSRTNTPLQALLLLNDTQFVEAARALAARELETAASDAEHFANLFLRVIARVPTNAETTVLANLLQRAREEYRADGEAGKRLIAVGESKAGSELEPAELAAWTLVAQLLLNLDETVTKR